MALQRRERRILTTVACVLIGAFLLALLDGWYPLIVPASPTVRYRCFGFICIFPCLGVPAAAVAAPKWWGRMLVLLAGVPLALIGLMLAFFAAVSEPTSLPDPSFAPVATAGVAGGAVVLYRTDCGATCAPGLLLRQERQIAPGVLLVRDLGDWYPAAKGTITPANGALTVEVFDAGLGKLITRTPMRLEVHPKPWLYF